MNYKVWKSSIKNPHWNNPYRGYVLFVCGHDDPKQYFDMYYWELFKETVREANQIPDKIQKFLMTDYNNPEDTGMTINMDIDLNSISTLDDCFIVQVHLRKIW